MLQTALCVVDAVAALDEEVKAGWAALSEEGGGKMMNLTVEMLTLH